MALEVENLFGVYPIDFILEGVIIDGIQWFRDNPETAPNEVFGQLDVSYLTNYGQKKIDEIQTFINDTEITVVQHWTMIPTKTPCFSIQLQDGREDESHAALDDFAEDLDEINGGILTRREIAYAAITDQMQIGIHASNQPDLVKYLYYLLVHILVSNGDTLKDRGLQMHSWSATDLSRMNEYLPEGVYSRFVNFTSFSTPRFVMRDATILDTITGVQVQDSDPTAGITLDEGE